MKPYKSKWVVVIQNSNARLYMRSHSNAEKLRTTKKLHEAQKFASSFGVQNACIYAQTHGVTAFAVDADIEWCRIAEAAMNKKNLNNGHDARRTS